MVMSFEGKRVSRIEWDGEHREWVAVGPASTDVKTVTDISRKCRDCGAVFDAEGNAHL